MHATCTDALITNIRHVQLIQQHRVVVKYDKLLADNICVSCCLAQERQNMLTFLTVRIVENLAQLT